MDVSRTKTVPTRLALALGLTSLAALAGSARALPGQEDPAGIEFFETRVRPLLALRCERCHGEEKQRAELRVDSRASLLAGGERGPALVPGDPRGSLLMRAVGYEDLELQMPPKGRLEDAEIALLEEWIERGAPAPEGERAAAVADSFDLEARLEHWSLQPLAGSDPRASVDAYLDTRLEQAGLARSVGAQPAVLLRRLSFDLVGLPPTVAELDDYLTAVERDGFEAAYTREVERLLASPHFGERWGRHWLDLVRYAETRGHEFDYGIANAWEYRDYVIRALDADVPYDEFLTEHLAGDLVEPQRRHPEQGFDESVLGTGFWFLGEQVHSPVDIRGDEVERQAGQVDVFSKTFLGLTVACARCHDHKFDAIPTEDYYALTGYLASTRYRQVRFESRGENTILARELAELRERQAPGLAAAVGRTLERELEGFGDLLLAARDVLEAEHRDPTTLGEDILFADFESESFDGWQAEGTAFADGPVASAGVQQRGALGERLVDSQRQLVGLSGDAGEAFTGTLTSPEFEVQRRYVKFLVGGGNRPGRTCVQLLVGGEVQAEATGRDDNRLRVASFDTGELRGRRARLRVVDSAAGPWGSIAVDQVVFSDVEGDVTPPTPEELAAAVRARHVQVVAARRRLPAERIGPAAGAVETARGDPGSPLHAFAQLACDFESAAPLAERLAAYTTEWRRAPPAEPEGTLEVVDWGAAAAPWIQDGVSFGLRPAHPGEAWPGADMSWPLEGVGTRAAARKDPTFDVLELALTTERESTRLEWIASGRTVYTPTFELERPRLFYLVRGAGRVHADVDSHRMNQGPLHAGVARSLDGDPEAGFRWVEHDLSDYVGERVSIEFSPAPAVNGRAPRFEVARVVQADAPPPPVERPSRDLLARLDSGAAPEDVARAVEENLIEAARALKDGSLRASPAHADLCRAADWAVGHPDLAVSSGARRDLTRAALGAVAQEKSLRERVVRRSRTAPAMLEGTPWSERVLIRGSHRSPGASVTPRAPAALGAELEPAARTDRLELAAILCDPEASPIVPRVHVNRVWQHLFGRGLVASVDDLGLMGERPTHPELLDHLARSFVAGGWSTKALIRELVHTEAYRRSSVPSEEALARDPDNLLQSHASVRRLDAEAIRDALLVLSGAFDPTVGGPSVKIHLTPFMEGRGRPPESGPLDGGGRRSVYLSVRRNFLVPMLSAFDFPQPATTMGRRGRSNVPAQALTLLNDPFVLEAAERAGERLLAPPERSAEERVRELYRAAFARPPSAAELELALGFVADAPEDPATWARLAHVLVNVKEFIFLR